MQKTDRATVERIKGQLSLPRPHRLTQEAIAAGCGVCRRTVNRIAVAMARKENAGLATTARLAGTETEADDCHDDTAPDQEGAA